MARKIESPCIGVCRLEGELCVGCGRNMEEISRWGAMKHPERKATRERAAKRLEKRAR
ncbi:DUF1289 domain-containing protein [Halomonas aquamarina]|uniref:DUF1289 domain-containing protein n=1 Tax=Vreelandella aquamarina TaxID=77097 RepID=A0ACC5VW46_9GAMM|nr:DUF1289 domain-containing protein [Halomonas aquamarina]MBZ5488508.1 DUF1289 domain-containing protein [Halomonas aquamarina]